MKLMNIILLLSLAGTVYPKNQRIDSIWSNDIYIILRSFKKIEQLWYYFTPEAQKHMKKLAQQEKNIDLKDISSDIDLKLLYLISSREDFFNKRLSIKQFNTILALEKEGTELINKGFTETEVCHRLFSSVLTHNGCETLAPNESESYILLKPLRDALLIHEKLNGLFNKQ